MNYNMKKILFLIPFISTFYVNSQTIIVDESLNKQKPFFNYQYSFPTNKLILNEASGKAYLKTFSYDADSNKDSLQIGSKFHYFNISENGINYNTEFLESAMASPKITYYSNNKYYEADKVKNYSNNHSLFTTFFNDQYQFRIVDASGAPRMDFEKDAIYLEKRDYTKKITKKISLKKPNILRLKEKSLLSIKNIGFRANLVDNDHFEIVTKSVSNDEKTATLYRTIYDLEGTIINDYSYSYTTMVGHLVRCKTREESMCISTNSRSFVDGPIADLGINEHYTDPLTGDVYIYGLYMDKSPVGFYLIKFEKEGKKIWEKFYEIDDKKGFNDRTQYWENTGIYLHKFMNENTFAVAIEGNHPDKYNHFFVVNNQTGEIERKAYADSKVETNKGGMGLALKRHSIFANTKLTSKRYCERNTLLAYNINEKVKKHIDGIKSKKEVFFDTYITAKGIWLLESDNDSYYKVTLFKD